MRIDMVKKSDKVLIVDDIETNRRLLKDIITKIGYECLTACNGRDAYEIVKKEMPILIMSDIVMPEMDGYEFCKKVKSNPLFSNIPFIFVSNYDNVLDVVKGFDVGGDDYVTRPFIPEIVEARLKCHIKIFGINNKLQSANEKMHELIENQSEQLEQEKKNILYALARVAVLNADYNINHISRMTYNTGMLARAIKDAGEYENELTDAFIEKLEVAAPLCDLGNVAVPVSILQKSEILSADEVKTVQNHAEIGYDLLRDIASVSRQNDFLEVSMTIARYHHEKWDGTGYPKGLKETDIPLEAQIVTVAGEYTSFTEDRVYRPAFSSKEAVTLMKRYSGKKYNPVIYQILSEIYQELK